MANELKIMLEPGTNRVVGWSRNPLDVGLVVDNFPPENYSDYRYIDGEYVFDPLPPEEIPVNPMEERIQQLEAQNEALLECLLEMSEIVYA